MNNYFRAAMLTAFIISVGFINIWNYAGLNKRLADTVPDRVQKLISQNLLIDEYAFFSPDIADSYNIYFLAKDNVTGEITEMPFNFYNDEMQNKIFSVLHKFYSYGEIRDCIAYALASHFFQQNENIHEIIFCFALYKLPSPREYKNGKRPHKELIYAREYFSN